MKISPKNITKKHTDKLMQAMERTDTEKFYFLTSLIKTQNLMAKMKISHKD